MAASSPEPEAFTQLEVAAVFAVEEDSEAAEVAALEIPLPTTRLAVADAVASVRVVVVVAHGLHRTHKNATLMKATAPAEWAVPEVTTHASGMETSPTTPQMEVFINSFDICIPSLSQYPIVLSQYPIVQNILYYI